MALLQQLHNRHVVTAILVLVALATSPPGASGGDPAAGAALLRFQAAADLIGGGGKALTWPGPSADPADPCKFKDRGWAGVSCDAGDKVFAVSVAERRLGGTVPANTLGAIPGLTNLTLAGTALTGPLPPDLTQHRALRSLVLTGNRLSAAGGGVPQFPNARNLTVLVLADAGLAGAVPDFLQSAPGLARLDVSGNPGLTGPVPAGLQRFGAAAFVGDDGLCGPPTPRACDEYGGGGRRRKKGLSTAEIAVIILADIFVLVLVTAGCYVCYSRRPAPGDAGKKKKKSKADADAMERGGGGGGQKEAAPADGDDGGAAAKNKLVFVDGRAGAGGGGGFDLEDLLRASAEMLGKGSLGTAYKAVLAGGAEVAVKRLRDLRDAGPAGRKEFEAAMEAVGKLRHPNLVPLKAYYYAREEKLLVYEYQPTGSLYTLLHENRQSPDRVPLDWATRLRCALGVARGLHHLHHGHHPGAPHGNIKSTNILMDANLEPCITDYGLAPLTAPGAATARLAAYRAPEYANLKHRPGGGLPLPLTHKADVYSFGVLLLELLTGRVPAQSVSAGVAVTTAAGTIVDPGIDLPRWVHSVVREEWTAEVFDLELIAYADIEEEMVGLLQVAMKCVVAPPDQRPSMGDVVKQVEEIRGPDPYADHDGKEEEEGDEEDYTTDFSSEMSFTTGAGTGTAQRGAGTAAAHQPAPHRS